MSDNDDVVFADFMQVRVCPTCDSIHVYFFDDDRDLVATGVIDLDHIETFIANLREAAVVAKNQNATHPAPSMQQ